MGIIPEEIITNSRIETLRPPSCNAAKHGRTMATDLRATRVIVRELTLIVDDLWVSPATPKLILTFGVLLLYLPYAPRDERVIEVSIKLMRRSLRRSLLDQSGVGTLLGAEDRSEWRLGRKDRTTYGEGRMNPAKTPWR